MSTKRCSHCRVEKPVEAFFTQRGGRYWQAWCKDCKAALARRQRAGTAKQGRIRFWCPPHGERSPQARLDNARVRLAKDLIRRGMSCAEIGRLLGVSRQTISGIKHGYRWTEVA